MDTFIWHSKSSADSALWLSSELGTENVGTVPPKGFSGVCICFGPKPSDKFKWESRNFQNLLNDPRSVDRDRKVIFSKLADAGVNVVSCMNMTEDANYASLCNLLGMDEATGFVAAKQSGAAARVVTSQAELSTALADGCNRALELRFLQTRKIRVFVVGGEVVAAVKRAPLSTEAFVQRAASQLFAQSSATPGPTAVPSSTLYENVLKQAIDSGLVTANDQFWTPFSLVTAPMRNAAITAADVLGLGFCAVDLEATNQGTIDILNVVTTPNLRDVPSAQQAIVNGLKKWVSDNSMTAKERLLAMVNSANEEEAAALLEDLRERKQELTETTNG